MSVRDTIELQDLFSPVINSVVSSVNSAVTAMEQMQKAMNVPMDNGALQTARAYADKLNDTMRQAEDISRNAKAAFGGLGSETVELAQKMSGAGDYAKQLQNDIRASGEVSNGAKTALNGLGNETSELCNKMNSTVVSSEHMKSGFESVGMKALELKDRLEATEKEINKNKIEALGNGSRIIETLGNESQTSVPKFNSSTDAISNLLIAAGGYKVLGFLKDELKNAANSSIEFESAITGVYKTVDGTQAQLEKISDDIKIMSIEIPSTTTEIAGVAESAGQLGIATNDVTGFTRVMIDLGESTNLSAEEAASSLAKFSNITGMSASNYENLGSAVVALGNNFATTEADIVAMSTRMASAGTLAGLTESDILGLAAAMSSVGIEAEAGGSAMSKLLSDIQVAVETGNDSLNDFASVAGMTVNQFSDLFENCAVDALGAFISGLNDVERNGQTATVILEDMGITEVRLSNAVKSLANSETVLSGAVSTASQAWSENTALAVEVGKRYETLESKIQTTKNAANKLKTAVGDSLNPIMNGLTDAAAGALTKLSELAEKSPEVTAGFTGFAGTVGVTVGTLMTVAPAVSSVVTAVSALKKSFDLSNASMLAFGGKAALVVAGIGAIVGVGTALYTSYKNQQKVVEDYNGTLEQCKKEIDSTQQKYDAVVKAYGDQSAAAAALNDEITTLTAQYEKGGGAAADYAARIEESSKSINEMTDNCVKQNETINNSQISAMTAIAQLQSLSGKAVKTASDLDYMRAAAEKLNSEYNMRINVDYNTGDITGFDKATATKAAVYQAEQNRKDAAYTTLTSEEYQNNYIESWKLLSETKNQMEKAREERDKYYEDNWKNRNSIFGWKQDDYRKGYTVLNEDYLKKLENHNNNAKNYNSLIFDGEELADISGIDFDSYISDLEDNYNRLNSIGPVENPLNDKISAAEAAAKAFENHKEEIMKLAEAYDEARESIRQSLDGMFGLFDTAQMNFDNAISFDGAAEALQSQIEYFGQYEESVKMLSELGLDNNIISQLDPAQAAAFADAINGMDTAEAQQKISDLNKKFGELSEIKDNVSKTLGDVKTGFSDGMKEIQENMQNDVKKLADTMENPEGAKLAAFQFISSYTNQLHYSGESAVTEAQRIADRVSSILSSASGSINISVNSAASAAPLKAAEMNASGTTNSADVFIAGENGPELIIGKKGSTVFPASETNRIISAVSGLNPVNYMSSNSYYSAENQSDYSTVNENVVNNYNFLQSLYDDSKIIHILENMQSTFSEIKGRVDDNKVMSEQLEYSVDMSLLEKLTEKYKSQNEVSNYSENVVYGDTYSADNRRSCNIDYGDTVKNINDFITSYSDEIKNISSISSIDNSRTYSSEYSSIFNSSAITSAYGDVINRYLSSTNYDDNRRNYSTNYRDKTAEYRSAADEYYTSENSESDRKLPETLPTRQINLNINCSGKINIPDNVNKDEVVSIILENLKPAFAEILAQEDFEEGESYYVY